MTKICACCKTVFSDIENSFHKNNATKDGYSAYCKECSRQRAKKWRQSHNAAYKQSVRNSQIKYLYGITASQRDQIMVDQQYKCQICKREFTNNICIDHDHETGTVRGLLCSSCNKLLGHSFENIDILKSAISYLETWKGV